MYIFIYIYIIYIYIYIYVYIYIYIYIYIYANIPRKAIVRLHNPRSGDNQGHKTFLAPSSDKQTCKYDTQCSNHHPSVSTLTSNGWSCSRIKW